jgi:hypothetical protein
MGELGFWIPSLQILLTFYFWNVVPILILLLFALFAILDRFNVSSKNRPLMALGILVLLVGIPIFVRGLIDLDLRYFLAALQLMGAALILFFIPTIVSYFFYKILIKDRFRSSILLVILIGLFFFTYPKKMVFEENKKGNILYVSDYIFRINQEEQYIPHRFVTRQSCSCLGISEEKYLAADYSPYCYGMTINCQEVTFDACEWVLPGLMCPNSEGEL